MYCFRLAPYVLIVNISVNCILNFFPGDLKKDKGIKAECKRFIALLDLKLLKDPIFVNIAFGLAACYTAGVFFGMIFPFFLIDTVHMTKSDTALCMSLLSAMDIVARLTLPTITHFTKISNRTTFLFGALALAIARAGKRYK